MVFVFVFGYAVSAVAGVLGAKGVVNVSDGARLVVGGGVMCSVGAVWCVIFVFWVAVVGVWGSPQMLVVVGVVCTSPPPVAVGRLMSRDAADVTTTLFDAK